MTLDYGASARWLNAVLVVFGNPRVGTPLMKCSPSIAIDLPQKALIWEDTAGKVWLSYNDPAFLKLRHATEGCDQVLQRVVGADP